MKTAYRVVGGIVCAVVASVAMGFVAGLIGRLIFFGASLAGIGELEL